MTDRNMKPLLGVAVQEAVRLAIVDCLDPDTVTDEDRERYRRDVHAIPVELWVRIDPTALGQNVACRLLGTGGWVIGDFYSGNATPAEVLGACVAEPHADPLAGIKTEFGIDEPHRLRVVK